MSELQAQYNTPSSTRMRLVSHSRSKEIAELGDWLDCHKHYISMSGLFPEDRKTWLEKYSRYRLLVKEELDFKEENK